MQRSLTLAAFYRAFLLVPPVSAAEVLSPEAAAAATAVLAAFAGAAIPGVLGADWLPLLFGLQDVAVLVVVDKLASVFLLQLLLMLTVKCVSHWLIIIPMIRNKSSTHSNILPEKGRFDGWQDSKYASIDLTADFSSFEP